VAHDGDHDAEKSSGRSGLIPYYSIALLPNFFNGSTVLDLSNCSSDVSFKVCLQSQLFSCLKLVWPTFNSDLKVSKIAQHSVR